MSISLLLGFIQFVSGDRVFTQGARSINVDVEHRLSAFRTRWSVVYFYTLVLITHVLFSACVDSVILPTHRLCNRHSCRRVMRRVESSWVIGC